MAQLKEAVQRKGAAVKAATARRDKVAAETAERMSRGWARSRELQVTLTDERDKMLSVVARAKEAEGRVSFIKWEPTGRLVYFSRIDWSATNLVVVTDKEG